MSARVVVVQDHEAAHDAVVGVLQSARELALAQGCDDTYAVRVTDAHELCDPDSDAANALACEPVHVRPVLKRRNTVSVTAAHAPALRASEEPLRVSDLPPRSASLPRPASAAFIAPALQPGAPAPGARVQRHPVETAEIVERLRSSELEVVFEPQIHLRTARLAGAVARIRCRSDGAVLRPAHEIRDASSHSAVELALILAREAAAAARLIAPAVSSLTMSIDVGSAALADDDFADRLEALLRHQASPAGIVLCVGDACTLVRRPRDLLRLRRKGYGVSLTESTVGVARFADLAALPLTQLSIDACIIADLSARCATAVLETHVALCRALHLTSAAQGVQAREHWALLHRAGCDLVQGCSVGEPMSAHELLRWTRAQSSALHPPASN